MKNFKSLATLIGALTVGSLIGIGMAPDQLGKAFPAFETTPSASQVVLDGAAQARLIDQAL